VEDAVRVDVESDFDLRLTPARGCNARRLDHLNLLVLDVAGYFDTGGAELVLTEPARVLDTRTGQGGWQGRADANQVLQLNLTQLPGWPGSAAVAFNLTGVDAAGEAFTRVWDCTGSPDHSNLNSSAGAAAGTFGVVRSTGLLCVVSNQKQNVILDLVTRTSSAVLPRTWKTADGKTVLTLTPGKPVTLTYTWAP
jgi:hypothetical protein